MATQTYFSKQWLDDPEFQQWLSPATEKTQGDASYAIKFLTYQTWEDRLL